MNDKQKCCITQLESISCENEEKRFFIHDGSSNLSQHDLSTNEIVSTHYNLSNLMCKINTINVNDGR